MDFLWRNVSEKEKEDIRNQAKQIMEKFSKKLEKVQGQIDSSESEKLEFERAEGKNPLEIDKKIMFENAPNKNKDFLIAEKKEW